MAATTIAAFHNAYRDLVVAGVTNLLQPPAALETASLPCKWVDSMSVESRPLRAHAVSGNRIFRCRVVIAMSPKVQDTHSANWTNTLAMADTLELALKAMTNPIVGNLHWTVTATPTLFVDWGFGVTADIEAEEFVA